MANGLVSGNPPPMNPNMGSMGGGVNSNNNAQAAQSASSSSTAALTPLQRLVTVNEETWLQVGRVAEQLADYDRAITAYESALRQNPYSVPAMSQIAAILRSKEQYGRAVEYFQSILNLDQTNGEIWGALGHCYLMMDDLQKAYSAYQQALYHLQNPKEPKLWFGIGILYDRYGSLEHAEEAFSQVMRMDPNFEKANEVYFRLGIIYKQQQKYTQSLECFQYILSNPPKPLSSVDIWFQIGHTYENKRDYKAAKDAYERVLAENPNHSKVLQQLGWLYHQQGTTFMNQDLAIQYLTKSLESDPVDAQSWYLLGRCYMQQQKYGKAYEAYQQAVYRNGENPTFWCSIGVLYYQINQYRDALDAYSRAIRLNPYISEIWYDLGTLYESCNNQVQDAYDAYQRAAELDPTNPHIKTRLQLLRSGQAGNQQQGNNVAPPHPQDMNPVAYQPPAPTVPWGVDEAPENRMPLTSPNVGMRPGEQPYISQHDYGNRDQHPSLRQQAPSNGVQTRTNGSTEQQHQHQSYQRGGRSYEERPNIPPSQQPQSLTSPRLQQQQLSQPGTQPYLPPPPTTTSPNFVTDSSQVNRASVNFPSSGQPGAQEKSDDILRRGSTDVVRESQLAAAGAGATAQTDGSPAQGLAPILDARSDVGESKDSTNALPPIRNISPETAANSELPSHQDIEREDDQSQQTPNASAGVKRNRSDWAADDSNASQASTMKKAATEADVKGQSQSPKPESQSEKAEPLPDQPLEKSTKVSPSASNGQERRLMDESSQFLKKDELSSVSKDTEESPVRNAEADEDYDAEAATEEKETNADSKAENEVDRAQDEAASVKDSEEKTELD